MIHAIAIDPNAAAAAAASIMAQKATKAANEAVAKYPPTELEMSTQGGKFYTTTDPFGHILPVVYIANQPCPLNEYTLLASCYEAASNNFDIIPQHVDNTVVEHQLPAVLQQRFQRIQQRDRNNKGTKPRVHRYWDNALKAFSPLSTHDTPAQMGGPVGPTEPGTTALRQIHMVSM